MNATTQSSTANETHEQGRQLAAQILAINTFPCVVLLSGTIGAGKTVFCQGIADGLGISDPILSPTFPLLFEYPNDVVPLYHFDLYRLGDAEEFSLIGGEDIIYGSGSYGAGISVIEWPECLGTGLQDLRLTTSILIIEVSFTMTSPLNRTIQVQYNT